MMQTKLRLPFGLEHPLQLLIQMMMMQASSFSSSASALDPLVADREKRKLNRMISDVLIAQRKDDSVSTRNIVKPKLVAGTKKR